MGAMGAPMAVRVLQSMTAASCRVMPFSGRKLPWPSPLTMPRPAAVRTSGSSVSSKEAGAGEKLQPLTRAASFRQITARRQNSARVMSSV